MREDDARRLLLVRAVESEDGAEAHLTREDRQQANAAGLGARDAKGRAGPRGDEAFLAGRAHFAYARLATRFPAVAKACRATAWPAWLDWLVPIAAFVLGLIANELDSGQRLNIIAFPLLGMLAWNLAVYLLLALNLARGALRRGGEGRRPGLFAGLLERIGGLARARADTHSPMGRALTRFAGDWLLYARPLTYRRSARLLHLSAAALAAGVIAGMYLRALGVEYRAGWESTFIGASTLHWLLGLVLGPASAITGIALPTPEHLEALRWSPQSRGENAGPWIHLYATTALLFIILPRLALWAWSAAAAWRLRARFPAPGREDFYVRRLLRGVEGGGAEVHIVPYSFHPPQPVRLGLEDLLRQVLGDDTRTTVATPIDYGAEDEWLSRAAFGAAADYVILLFNLSATPEAENQGALVAGLKRRLADARTGAILSAILDESAYRQRLGAQAGAEERLATRRAAWERMLAREGLNPLSLHLEAGAASPDLVRRVEGGLLQGASLHAAGRAA
ncbi:MAG TPA: DUF2868 domain-containing protein [Allosphingosinicella sp.]